MKRRDKLLEKNKIAIRVRESGDLLESRKLFERLVGEISSLLNSKDESDLNAYFQIMGEWVIQLRHEGKSLLRQALDEAFLIYEISKRKRLENIRILRGISNTLMNLESYESAEGYLKRIIRMVPRNDSARLGDSLAHLARCKYRLSEKAEAKKLVTRALSLIEENTGCSSSLEIAVWKSHALIVESILQNSEGERVTALETARDALRVAKEENVAPRIDEARELVRFLKSQK